MKIKKKTFYGRPKRSTYFPASTATLGSADVEAYVYTDPGIVYEAQFTAGTPAVSFIGAKWQDQKILSIGSVFEAKHGFYLKPGLLPTRFDAPALRNVVSGVAN